MNYYSEEEIRAWFEKMIEKYPNSNMEEHLKAVIGLMFDSIWESNHLEKIKKDT